MATNTGSKALTAKVHAMHGRRLSALNYRELVRKQSVSEVASYIKQQTDYGPLLRDINENAVHRGQLENILRRDLFDQYMKVFHYISHDEMRFYSYLIVKMEIDEILSCIRYLNAGREDEYIFSLPSFFAKHADIDLYSLAKVKTFDELLNLLKGTAYYDILKQFDPKENDKIDNVQIEIAFNKYYYSHFLDVIEKTFSGPVKKNIRNSFGMQIDLNNITDIIRMKKYYNANVNYIKTLILPYYFRARRGEIEKIMEAPDSQAAWQAACETYYGGYFKKYSYEFVDKYAQQIMYEYHKNLFTFTDSAPVAVVAYLQLKETEIQNIITIVEGIRYGLAPSEIDKLLIGTEG